MSEEKSTEMEPERIDTRTEEGAQRSAELKAETAEKRRKVRRTEAELIADGIKEISKRFEAFAYEQVNSSLESALERGEVVTISECERREKAAAAEARAAMRKFLNENTGAEK